MGSARELTTLRFTDGRFAGGRLDIEVLPELVNYRRLLVETAKSIWLRRNPRRKRVPKHFEAQRRITIQAIRGGSTLVPIQAERLGEQGLALDPLGEFTEAADLIESVLEAAATESVLPKTFPKALIGELASLGETLRADEKLELRSPRREVPAACTPRVRRQLKAWLAKAYEDVADIIGEVRAADLDGCKFVVRDAAGERITASFGEAHEAVITRALQEHDTLWLRIRGRLEVSSGRRLLTRITRIESLEPIHHDAASTTPTRRPIWEILDDLGKIVPDEEWERVPEDFSTNLDHYLYGTPRKS